MATTSGNFHQYNSSAGNVGVYCTWSSSTNKSTNSTDITVNVYRHFYSLYTSSSRSGSITINGKKSTFTWGPVSDSNDDIHNTKLASKTVTVKHNANGTIGNIAVSASVDFSGITYNGVSLGTITASKTLNDLANITVYKLTTSAGSGSSITVNRTSSGFGSTGNLSSGSTLYYGDKLKISFSASANYELKTHTVNGSSFTSGNTHTVSGNVSVASTASQMASNISATNAYIGKASTITITRYKSSYVHTIAYKFGTETGFIDANGNFVKGTSAYIITGTSLSATIPESFYKLATTSKSGTCTLTCNTYTASLGGTKVGNSTTCTFTVSFDATVNTPTFTYSFADTNALTRTLTGGANKFIKGKSTLSATLDVHTLNSATLKTVAVEAIQADINTTDLGSGHYTVTITSDKISTSSIKMTVTDSRGFAKTLTGTISLVNYVALTCNATAERESPTSGNVNARISGYYFDGYFGDNTNHNDLTIMCQYSVDGGSYSDLITIYHTGSAASTVGVSTSTNNTYKVMSLQSPYGQVISMNTALGVESFDYDKEYSFRFVLYDGIEGTHATYVSSQPSVVQRGIPIFDWGKDDFNFNVPVNMPGLNVNGIPHKVSLTSVAPSSVSITSDSPTMVCQITLDPGFYILIGHARWASVSTGVRRLFFSTTPNASTDDRYSGDDKNASADGYTRQHYPYVFTPTSRTTIYLNAWHNRGSALNGYFAIQAIRFPYF